MPSQVMPEPNSEYTLSIQLAIPGVRIDDRGEHAIVSVMAGYARTNHIVPFGLPPEKPVA